METQNDLLRALSDAQIARLGPLEKVTLHRHQYVYQMDDEVTHLYFMERCHISLIRPLPDGKQVPVWSYDGTLVGSQIRFWVPDGIYDMYVRIGGDGWRVPRERMLGAMMIDRDMGALVMQWIHYFDHAVAISAACQMVHSVEQRLCRLLLAAQIAMKGGRRLDLALPEIAAMLPAGRSHVYRLATALQRAGAISIGHSHVDLRDVKVLAARACACFERISERRRRALGDP